MENWRMEFLVRGQTLAEVKKIQRHLSGRLAVATAIRYSNEATLLHT